MTRLLIATNNPGKVRELRRLLTGVPFEIVTPADLDLQLDPEETGTTYAENAAIKARAFATAAGCLALADDSGIEVDALNGGPGVRSARYGDPELDDEGRARFMLEELQGVPDGQRTARYRALVAVANPTGQVELFEGVFEGRIGHQFQGTGGFGYDPIFLVGPEGTRTGADLSPDEKDAVSHRGQAVRKAAAYLNTLQVS